MIEQELLALINDPSRKPVWMGTFSPEYRYDRDQVVVFWNFVYIAERGVPLHNPGGVTNDYYWKLLRASDPNSEEITLDLLRNSVEIILLEEPYDPKSPYFKGNCVFDEVERRTYIASRYVPENVEGGLSNTEYWSEFIAGLDDVTCSQIDASGFELLSNGPTFNGPACVEIPLVTGNLLVTADVGNYLVGSAAVIFNEHDEVLLGLRADNDTWSLFGGKAKLTESMAEAAAREIGEEIGLTLPASRYRMLGIREDFNGDRRCLTAYSYTKLTSDESRLVWNAEPLKCKELRWFPRKAIPAAIWQDGAEMIARAVTLKANEEHMPNYVL